VVCMDGKRLRGTIDLEVNDGLCLLAIVLFSNIVTQRNLPRS